MRVDGRDVAVLRYSELPPGLAMVASPRHPVVRYFRVADYLKSLGVRLADVRSVHFLGNRGRVASLEGAELRAAEARFVFDFTRTTEGSPAVMWDTRGLKNQKRIDFIRGIEVFVSSPAPALDVALGCYPIDAGACAEDSAREVPHGTRVYVDGRLAALLKRRDVSDRTTLAHACRAAGVDSESVRGVEFVSGDAIVARASGVDLKRALDSVTLASATRGHGQIVATLPASMTGRAFGEPVASQVEAILVYRSARVPSRPIASLEDAQAPNLAMNEVTLEDR